MLWVEIYICLPDAFNTHLLASYQNVVGLK